MSELKDDDFPAGFLESMSFHADLQREAARLGGGYLKVVAAEAPGEMLLLHQAGWTTATGGRNWQSPYDSREMPLTQAALHERERRASLHFESAQEHSNTEVSTGVTSTTIAASSQPGSLEEVRRVLRDVIDYVERGVASSDLARAEKLCGRHATRLTLINLLSWLGYLSRGGRNQGPRRLEKSPLSAMRLVLAQDLALHDFFEMKQDLLDWRAGVSADVRATATAFVGEHHRPRLRE